MMVNDSVLCNKWRHQCKQTFSCIKKCQSPTVHKKSTLRNVLFSKFGPEEAVSVVLAPSEDLAAGSSSFECEGWTLWKYKWARSGSEINRKSHEVLW